MKRSLRTISLLIVGILLLGACGSMSTASSSAPAMEAKSEAPRAQAPPSRPAPERPSTAQPAQPRPQIAGATTFKDYPRATFVSTARDAISTFSLDTDRTSFHLALNWARSNYRVEPDSVRAEEWVNTFNYDYAFPLREDSFAITSDVVAHPLDSELHIARISFQAADLVHDDTPVNVTLVLDASGSMSSGNRVAIAREAAESIRRSLRAQDRIAVVHFTDFVISQYTVEHSEPNDSNVAWSIGRLAPHQSTNVQAGLNLGVRLADRIRDERPDSYNYVILMSDGVANVNATDPFAILETAEDYDSSNPLRLITIVSALRISTTTCWNNWRKTVTVGTAISVPSSRLGRPSAGRTGWRSRFRSLTRPAPR